MGTKMKTGPVDQRIFRQKLFSALNSGFGEEWTQSYRMTMVTGQHQGLFHSSEVIMFLNFNIWNFIK